MPSASFGRVLFSTVALSLAALVAPALAAPAGSLDWLVEAIETGEAQVEFTVREDNGQVRELAGQERESMLAFIKQKLREGGCDGAESVVVIENTEGEVLYVGTDLPASIDDLLALLDA